MEHLRPPEPLRLTADGGRNWRLFRQKFEFFLQATACTDKPRSEAAKTALLLSVAGEDALDVFNNFVFTEGESKEDYATVIAKFEEYCVEQENEIHERYVFRSRRQGEAEPFEQFVRALKRQAQHCNFGAMTDDMVRDQVVFGTNSPKLREKMLRDKNLTLGKAVTLCKAAETSARQNEVWGKANEELDMSADTYSRRWKGVTLATEGTCKTVSLRAQAQRFFSKRTYVDSWGLTRNYSYWKEGRNRTGEYPIRGKVDNYQCIGNDSVGIKGDLVRAQWVMRDALHSPVRLHVTLTVPMTPSQGMKSFTFSFDLNNKTRITAQHSRRNITRAEPRAIHRILKNRTCNFTFRVTFDGWFAYHINRSIGDEGPYYVSAVVGDLENKAAGLLRNGDNLTYTIRGDYTEVYQTKAVSGPERAV